MSATLPLASHTHIGDREKFIHMLLLVDGEENVQSAKFSAVHHVDSRPIALFSAPPVLQHNFTQHDPHSLLFLM